MSAQDAARDSVRALGLLTADDFTPCLDTSFRLQVPAGGAVTPASAAPMEVTLAEIRRLGAALRDGGAFALVFVARNIPNKNNPYQNNSHWPQGIYPVSHPALGTLDMFLVPIGPFADGFGYEAVFT
jgi:hypothetical protein